MLSYIMQLPEGTKVSVRELSSQLQVSEGTAYKAVKEAEQRGLVLVKPKAGTVRVNSEQSAIGKSVRVSDLCRVLGLNVVAGKGIPTSGISKLVICDGSEKALQRQLAGSQPESCLCLCGDRPDLQIAVLEKSCHLLLTGGAQASWMLISTAERVGRMVFSSAQSAYSLIRLFDEEFVDRTDFSGSGKVSSWMQTPDYLYYNDIVADWQQMYLESSISKQYPLVDDNLELYGGLDLWKAATAVPSQKLRTVVADKQNIATVSLSEDLKNVAKRFVINGESLAAVMDGKRMVGVITANDLLRYYMYTQPNSYESAAESFLDKDLTVSGGGSAIYRIRIPESEMQNIRHIEMNLILSAAGSHLLQVGCQQYKLESGTFFTTKRIRSSEGLILTSKLQQTGKNSYVIEVEINDDATTYAKAILHASRLEQEEE